MSYAPPAYYRWMEELSQWVEELAGCGLLDLEGIEEYPIYEAWENRADQRLVAQELIAMSDYAA